MAFDEKKILGNHYLSFEFLSKTRPVGVHAPMPRPKSGYATTLEMEDSTKKFNDPLRKPNAGSLRPT